MLGPCKLARDPVARQDVLGCYITSVFLGGGFTRVGSRPCQTPKVKLRANVVRHNFQQNSNTVMGLLQLLRTSNLFARLGFTA